MAGDGLPSRAKTPGLGHNKMPGDGLTSCENSRFWLAQRLEMWPVRLSPCDLRPLHLLK